jgi:hypothetical protein
VRAQYSGGPHLLLSEASWLALAGGRATQVAHALNHNVVNHRRLRFIVTIEVRPIPIDLFR